MADTTFVDRQTPIYASWLNDVNDATYNGTGVFTPLGTGVVPRTNQDKLREFVSVKDYGAVGDGITDDSDAINSALANNTHVYLPAGNYLCKKQIVINRGKELWGAGKGSYLYIDFTTIANFPGNVGVAVYVNSLPANDSVNLGYGRSIQDFSIYGVVNSALTSNATIGIKFYCNRSLSDGTYNSNNRDQAVYFSYIGSVNNLHVRRFDVGFELTEVWHSKFNNCVAAEVRIGYRINGKTVDIQFNGCDSTSLVTTYTPTVGSTYGWWTENGVYLSGLNGWPEGIMISGGTTSGGVTYGAWLAGTPFEIGLYRNTLDCVSANIYVAGTVQDLRIVGCNATIRSDAGACVDFATTTDSALSHSALIHGNFFDCQAPTATNADGIRYPTTNVQRYAQTITNNRFRNAFRYCINGGGSATTVGGFGYSLVSGNVSQQQTGGSLLFLGYSGQYSTVEHNHQSAAIRVLDQDNAPNSCNIGTNISSVQLTGKQKDFKTSQTITAVDQTFTLATVDYLNLYEHSTLVIADVTIRGTANYTRRYVFRISYTSVFGATASSITTDANYTFDQTNANYILTFSPSVTVNSNTSFSFKLTIRSTGVILIGAAEFETKVYVVTPKESINIS